MKNDLTPVPAPTIETLARSFYKQGVKYGFKREDYLRFVNVLLEVAMHSDAGKTEPTPPKQEIVNRFAENDIHDLPIHGERIRIRAVSPETDKTLLKKWVADPFGRYFLLSRTTEKTVSAEEMFETERTIIGIITLHDDSPIGAVAYINYDPNHPKAELRKIIGQPDMRGKGYGREATKLWIQYGLSCLGLKKIYLHTLNTNIRNIKINEGMGFRVEGILRNEALIDGDYHDVLRMGLWRE